MFNGPGKFGFGGRGGVLKYCSRCNKASNVNENVSELNVSTDSTSPSSTNFSVSSESNLFVPSKLHSDIFKLKTCYTDIIKLIDPYKNSSTSLENPNTVLMLNKEQMVSKKIS